MTTDLVQKDIKKSLENPILDVVQTDNISEVMNETKSKQKVPANQISPKLELYEKKLINSKKSDSSK